MPPLISILMPACNAQQYILDSIKSVQAQTIADWELIIIDDASDDGTREVVRQAANQDQRIHLHTNAQRLGLAGNRNRAVALAKGQFLAILDADDIAMPSRLEKQLDLLRDNESIQMVGSWAEVIDADSQHLAWWRFPARPKQLRAQFYLQFPVVHSSLTFRRSLVATYGLGYQPEFEPAEDYDFCFRALQHGQVALVPEYLTKYRLHRESTSARSTTTITRVLPALYQREYSKLGIELTLADARALAQFLNPAQVKPDKLFAFTTIQQVVLLGSMLRRRSGCTWWDVRYFYWYVVKLLLLNLFFCAKGSLPSNSR